MHVIQKLKKKVRNAMMICAAIAIGSAVATPALAAHGGGGGHMGGSFGGGGRFGGGFGGGHTAGGFGRGGGEFHGGGRRFGERFEGGDFAPGFYDYSYDGLNDDAGDSACFQYRYVQSADGGQWRQVWACN
jgi:hypothetical protein